MRNFSRKLYISVTIFLILTLLIGCSTNNTKEQASIPDEQAIRQGVLDYLEDKYNDSFVIRDIRYEWNTKDYYIEVSPEEDLMIKFHMFINKELNTFGDTYLLLYWKKDAKKQFKEVLDKQFTQVVNSKELSAVMDWIDEEFEADVKSKINEGLPTYEYISEHHPDKIELRLRADIILDINDNNEEEVEEKIRDVIDFYVAKNISIDDFLLYFYDEANNRRTHGVVIDDIESNEYVVDIYVTKSGTPLD